MTPTPTTAEPAPRLPAHILVVEDNAELAFGLRNSLEIAGHEVTVAPDGEIALGIARDQGVDLVILDLMLPGLDGYRVLQALRGAHVDAPVLILTARNEEADKVVGFRLGADDYVTKPFGLMELLARVDALLRRADRRPRAPEPLRAGALTIDLARREVCRKGTAVALTPREFDLLEALVLHAPRAISRQALLRAVWRYDAAVSSRTVDTHVAELRRKLEEDPAAPCHIVTVWKIGYRWQA